MTTTPEPELTRDDYQRALRWAMSALRDHEAGNRPLAPPNDIHAILQRDSATSEADQQG